MVRKALGLMEIRPREATQGKIQGKKLTEWLCFTLKVMHKACEIDSNQLMTYKVARLLKASSNVISVQLCKLKHSSTAIGTQSVCNN